MKHRILFTITFVFALAITWWGNTPLKDRVESRNIDQNFEDKHSWLEAPYQKALVLNYDTFLTDLIWIDLQLYLSNFRAAGPKATPPQHMLQYGSIVHELDPEFIPLYEWLNATYINSRLPISSKDLHTITDFYIRGAPYSPSPGQLYYHAGLNFIGYSSTHTTEEKIAGLQRGIKLLRKSSQYPDSSEQIPNIVSYMFRRIQQLQDKQKTPPKEDLLSEKVTFYKEAYMFAPNQDAREYIVMKLQELGLSDDDINRIKNASGLNLDDVQKQHQFFLPENLWLALYGEHPQHFIPAPKENSK